MQVIWQRPPPEPLHAGSGPHWAHYSMLVGRREDEQRRTAHRKEPGRDGADTQQDDAKSRCFYVFNLVVSSVSN